MISRAKQYVCSLLCFFEKCLDLSLSPLLIRLWKGCSTVFVCACVEHSNIGFEMSLQKHMAEAKGMALFCYSLRPSFKKIQ